MTVKLQDAVSPQEIEARSFAIIDSEVPEPRPFNGPAWEVARRLVHTAGDTSLLKDLVLPEAAVLAGARALTRGACVYTDTEMVRSGIPVRRLEPLGARAECFLNLPGVAEAAGRQGITRARAGLAKIAPLLAGAVVAIGNAPTALLALLEETARLGVRPALVVGMPVGFVNAAESKELLLQRTDLTSLVIRGRRGGSPLAAAAVNAMAVLAMKMKESD